MVILWGWLWWPTLSWLGGKLGTAALLLVPCGLGALLLVRGRQPAGRLPAALALSGAALSVGIHRFMDVDHIDAVLFGVSAYGVLGLFLDGRAWLRALPAVLALGMLLPFDDWIDTFLGFPARIWTAARAAELLNVLGFSALDSATVLTMDHGNGRQLFAVDVPCAGVRSLYVGTLALVGLAAIEGRIVGARWLASLCLLWLMIALANVMRVTTLVGLAQLTLRELPALWDTLLPRHLFPLLANVLHQPLGLLGLLFSLVVARLSQGASPSVGPLPAERPIPALGLVGGLLTLIMLDQPAVEPSGGFVFTPQLPAEWAAQSLTKAEREFFGEFQLQDVQKYSFTVEGRPASLALIPARTWRAHHLPSNCQAALEPAAARIHTVTDGFTVRIAKVQRGVLVWWFQAPDQITDDLFARTWADLSGAQDRWVMVSLLIDGEPPVLAPSLRSIAAQVQTGFGEVE